jgi:hypothetical protein
MVCWGNIGPGFPWTSSQVSGHSRRQGKEKMKKYPVTAIVVLLLVAVSSPPTPASLADGRDDSAQKLQRLDSFLAGVDRI